MSSYPYGATDPTIYDVGDDEDCHGDEPHEDDCDHDDYEGDICTGRATCWRCGYRWWMTIEEMDAEIERHRAYDEWQRQQEHPWFRFKQWIAGIGSSIRWRWKLLTQKPKPLTDDEIPF